VKKQIEDMLRNNIIRPSTSPFACPILLVAKKEEGQMRFCVDYRPLNNVTVRDRYPIPNIKLIIDSLHGAKYFSTLDLLSGYWQIEIEEKHKYKICFHMRKWTLRVQLHAFWFVQCSEYYFPEGNEHLI
jgi:hypothetical protein